MEKLIINLDRFRLMSLQGGEKFYELVNKGLGVGVKLKQLEAGFRRQEFDLAKRFRFMANLSTSRLNSYINTPEENTIHVVREQTGELKTTFYSTHPELKEASRVFAQILKREDDFSVIVENVLDDETEGWQAEVRNLGEFLNSLVEMSRQRDRLLGSVNIYKGRLDEQL